MHLTRDASFLLPDLVSHRAKHDPHGVFARVPVGPTYTSGFNDVTNAQLSNAINFTASLLLTTYGESNSFETLAYIGSMDLRYSIMVLAGIKTGYKVFLPSPRNSIEAHVALLTRLRCGKLVVTEPQSPCIPSILSGLDLSTFTLPSLDVLLNVGDVEDIPFMKTFEEAKNDPIFVLHTSGSTGVPKPLIYTHEWASKCVGSSCISPLDGLVDFAHYITNGSFFITLPPFHVAGVGMTLVMALYHGMVPVYPIPGPPPTTQAFIDAISNTDVDWALVSPVVVDELGKRQDLIQVAASRLKYISYAGGSVPKASGDAVAQKLPIWTVLGSSEAGLTPLVHDKDGYDNAKDWVYMHFNPALKHEMRHSHDDFYELILVRNADTDIIQPVFTHFPDAKEFATRDLFRPHPTKNDLWLYHSRIDDVIVFLNGEKTNPISFEHHIMSHPEVKAALVVGAQRVEAALLIETATDAELTDDEKSGLVERVWPLIEEANKVTPAHARVAKSKIIFVNSSIPMARAGKGTVQRAATLALYAAEIEEVYQQEESLDASNVETSPEMSLKILVRNAVAEMVSMDDLDFFQLGMDSLGALRLQRALKKRFPGANISNDTVYSNSSVNTLVRALEKVISAPAVTATNATIENISSGDEAQTDLVRTDSVVTHEPTTTTKELEKMLATFTEEIDAINPQEDVSAPRSQYRDFVILLTGTTGAIGSYILDALLSRPEIAHVFCFNRTADAQGRQIKTNQARALVTNFPPERVTFLNGDLTKPSFGLATGSYDELLTRVTHIVHNAWPVNFNMSLASFAPSVEGVVSLIRFSAKSKANSSIQFLSSISSVFNYPEVTVPEEIIFDMSTPLAGGYGQSKYLAERLLDHASKRLGVHASAVRIGQVAGAARTAGGWNQQEWFPSLVTTSAFMGVLPARLGNGADKVDWIPIDHLAEVLVELALASQHVEAGTCGAAVNQIVHPYPVTWTACPTVRSTARNGYGLRP
ncbi:uncharacterized protein EKO05_0002728 [Ascochyta rabiei]|uniref:uncharacterized protein n=1 Tax=Didymella rabiei TaxID=5454 RepID=UPI00190123C7|nr:uncharacterized protein EKO05_0002728 [Ascochyta rabiei]UPX12162.1 hypothetical protein EKO05_0002728 [Ascochyta rabiei]